jgi:hypothetical protein
MRLMSSTRTLADAQELDSQSSFTADNGAATKRRKTFQDQHELGISQTISSLDFGLMHSAHAVENPNDYALVGASIPLQRPEMDMENWPLNSYSALSDQSASDSTNNCGTTPRVVLDDMNGGLQTVLGPTNNLAQRNLDVSFFILF